MPVKVEVVVLAEGERVVPSKYPFIPFAPTAKMTARLKTAQFSFPLSCFSSANICTFGVTPVDMLFMC